MATFRSMYSRRWFDKPNFNKGSIMVFLREEIVTTLFSVENQPITSSVDNILEDKTFQLVITYCQNLLL